MVELPNQQSLQNLLQDIITSHQDCFISHITHDSREVKPGSLFLAYPGLQCDARDFIANAIAQGASAVLYEEEGNYSPPIASIPLIPIKNLRQQEGVIAARFFADPSAKMNIIGVTGTNGKTSITQFIAKTLCELNEPCAVLGTLGNGFPDQLQASKFTTLDAISLQQTLSTLYQQQAKHVAMEVSSHGLSMGRVNAVHFSMAVFTQLSRDHLDYHGSMRAYADAKKMLFHMPGIQKCIINLDDNLGREIVNELSADKLITYSVEGRKMDNAQYIVAESVSPLSTGFQVKINSAWGRGELHSRLLGRFNIENLFAVLGVLLAYNIPFSKALEVLSNVTTVPGRMQVFGGHPQPMVIVDYSHTPDALAKALSSLREHCQGKLWCVFGCGGNRDRGKRAQMAKIAEQYSDHVIVTNDNPRHEKPEQIATDIMAGFTKPDAVQVELDRKKAISHAVQQAKSSDVILIAGKGHEDYQLIEDRVLPFSDSQEVQQQLRYRD